MLERPRVTAQAAGERNYHIFYQLLAGLGPDKAGAFGLAQGVQSFRVLNASGCTTIAGVDDAAECAPPPPPPCSLVFLAGHAWRAMHTYLHKGRTTAAPAVLCACCDGCLKQTRTQVHRHGEGTGRHRRQPG